MICPTSEVKLMSFDVQTMLILAITETNQQSESQVGVDSHKQKGQLHRLTKKRNVNVEQWRHRLVCSHIQIECESNERERCVITVVSKTNKSEHWKTEKKNLTC